MINTLKPAIVYKALTVTALFMVLTPAFAQAPTEAQRSAIRSACRSDYMAHCSSVSPGGIESLQCLQKNMSSLAPGCQSAVRAVEAPAAPKAESQPAAAPREEAAPAVEKTEKAEPAPAKPATAASPAAPKTASKPNTAARKPSSAQTSASPAAAAAPVPVLVLRPMLPREEFFVLRSACRSDVHALCGGVAPGGGRIMQCLANQAASLSPECRGVLGQFAAQ